MKAEIVELERKLSMARAHVKQAKREGKASLTWRAEVDAHYREIYWRHQAIRTSQILKGH